jgi:hypothetical protein
MKRPAQLSESLHHQLNAYALAASAAGVGVLALTQPVEAKIIYTPANKTCRCRLDVNHDGKMDFDIKDFGSSPRATGTHPFFISSVLSVGGLNRANRIWGYSRVASALSSGVRIAASPKFKKNNNGMAEWFIQGTSVTTRSGVGGPWANVQNRYLGLKFISVTGKMHYGWARLNVSVTPGQQIIATLTGYAYETIPNKPIIAGKTHGKDDATLGRLAQGASDVSNGGKP